MNYPQQAAGLASRGRYGDTMVMHVNPMEVAIMDRMTPGGLTINPDTGQPEAFAFLLPLLTSLAAPGLLGAAGVTGTGALLGTAAATGAADYLVNKDPARALGSGLLSFGLGGLGNAMEGAKAGTDAAKAAEAGAQAASGAGLAPAVSSGAGIGATINNALTNNPITMALGDPARALSVAVENPFTVGLPILAGAQSAFAPLPFYGAPNTSEYYDEEYRRERFPVPRSVRGFAGDYGDYGAGPEAQFFGYRDGGPVMGLGDGMSDSIPVATPSGRPALLSDGEYVIPADVVSLMGRGSTGAGYRALDQMVAETRANPPRKDKGPPKRRKAA